MRSPSNKTEIIRGEIIDRDIDTLAMTELWLRGDNNISLREAAPSDYAVPDVVREASPGHCVITVIYSGSIKCTRVDWPPSSTFDKLCAKFTTGNSTMLLQSIDTPINRTTKMLVDELASCR